MDALTALLAAIGYSLVFWQAYKAAMADLRAWPTLSTSARVLATPGIVCALVMDVVYQLAATLVFLDLPAWRPGERLLMRYEWLFTWRCERYLRDARGWRTTLARWCCRNLLDPYQAGGHCH